MADTTHGAVAPMSLRITRKRFPRRTCDPLELPFVQDVKTGRKRVRKFWVVPAEDCYATANVIGAQYAADLVQYLRENGDVAGGGLLVSIVKEMHLRAADDGGVCGIAAGFWSLLEHALQSPGSFDAYGYAEGFAARVKVFLDEVGHE